MSPRRERDPRGVLLWVVGLAVLCAALALGAGAGLAAVDGGSQPAVVPVENTTSYLLPAAADAQSRQWVGRVGVDASIAVTSSAHSMHGRFERRVLDERYFAAEDPTERSRIFRDRVDALDRRIDGLVTARREAIAAHSAGELSTPAFLRTLSRIDAATDRASALHRLLQNRSILAGGPPRSYQTTLRNLRVELASMGGPATEQMRETMIGRAEGGGTYVYTVGTEGLVVATIEDGVVYRDALDGTQRQVGGINHFTNESTLGVGVAYQRGAELYPWIFRANVAPGPATPYGNTSVYSISVDHSQGRLSTFLDGSTENVFREIQQKRLRVVPTDDVGTETAGDLQVTVLGTHPTGPLLVRVTGAGDGEPVDSVVRVNGARVGTTGADGELWTIQPDGPVTVNATAGGESVALSFG